MSMLDMITDVQVIEQYMGTPGQEGYARSLIAMISLCLLFQLAVVWLQTRKGAKAVMLREMLIVLSALKPGADAYRVANGEEQDAGAKLTPEMELGKRERNGGGGGRDLANTFLAQWSRRASRCSVKQFPGACYKYTWL